MWALPDRVPEEVRAAVPAEWEVVVCSGSTSGAGDGARGVSMEVRDALAGAEVYVGFGVPPEVLEAGPDLRWVHSGAAGVGSSLTPAMRRRIREGLVFTNSAGVHGPPMAESVVAGILHFARGFDLALGGMRRREWDPEPFLAADTPVRELAGSTAAIIGYGGTGREVARRLAALGVRVIGVRRSAPAEGAGGPAEEGRLGGEIEVVHGDGGRRRALAAADHVVVTAPHTAETEGMIDRKTLERTKRGAVLVNVSRGALVDEEALVEVLRSGHLRGAYLDVAREEPLPAESPLWEMPNVLVTPHVSAVTGGFWRRETDLLVENLRRWLAGEELVNVVDPQRGY